MTQSASAIWIDVEDLFHYVQHNARLSGIQRLTYELYTALGERAAQAGRRLGFVRIDPRGDLFRVVAWEQVRTLCHGLTVGHEAGSPAALAVARPVAKPGRLDRLPRRLAVAVQSRLPGPARDRFHRFCVLQSAALTSLAGMGRAGLATGRQPARKVDDPASAALVTGTLLRDVARPGDWLLSLGASWHRTDYGALLGDARRETGLRTGVLFYDLIPLRRPEWCHHTLVDSFGRWLDGVLPETDALFSISDATGRDVADYLRAHGRTDPVETIPVGTGFPASEAAVRQRAEPLPDAALPRPGSYVLFVSTIEARKNHALMFQVWRRLAEELPAAELPTLVFAGRIGWLVADLMLQIANTNYCDGKLLIVEDPSDAVLLRLYEGCLFTVLPSLFEGWGLPVTESLALGKPCVTSDNTSLPEAGAGLTRMIDAYDVGAATRTIRDILADRPGLAAWETEVKAGFSPVLWTRSADALLEALAAREAAIEAMRTETADA